MHVLAAIDADVVRVLTELKELFQRVTALEHRLNGYVVTLAAVFAICGFIGWRQIKAWVNDAVKRAVDPVKARVDAEVSTYLERRKKEMTVSEVELDVYMRRAAEASNDIRAIVENAKANAQDVLLWETGEDTLVLTGSNYANRLVKFRRPFPEEPQVFVGEANAGEWVYAKVDEKHPDRFVWAARSLSGGPINYTTRIQWFAVAKVPTMKPPPENFAYEFEKLVEKPAEKPAQ
jgi:hypothetical protein